MLRLLVAAATVPHVMGPLQQPPGAYHRVPTPPRPDRLVTTRTISGPITETTLANGLKVILKESHASPVVTWVVAYKVGSRNEGPGNTGSAHLLEHMMFKGTKTLGKGQVAQILDRNGASSNASTWTDWTRYYETYSADRLELGMLVEAARMRDALILDTERQSEMTVVRNELERGESDPNRQLSQALWATAFKAHPYHHPTIGWRSDVEGVSTAELKRFYDTYYQPNNAVAVLVGDFKTRQALELIHRYFDPIQRGPLPPLLSTTEEPQVGERRVTLRRRGATNMVRLGYHIPAMRHHDIGALLVADAVLSNGVTSRMVQAITEKQLAAEAWSDVGLNRDPSLFQLGATLMPGGDHAAVERLLQAQADALARAPVSEAELAKAKAQARASYVYQNEGTQGLAFALASAETQDHWQRSFTLLDDLTAVTAADVQRVARTYLTVDNRTSAWYVATPDGPQLATRHEGKARGKGARPAIHAPFPFEQRDVPARQGVHPVRMQLANGLTVIVLANPDSQTVALDGYVTAGALEDPGGKDGLAAATASLLTAGTRQHTKLELAQRLEGLSASLGFSGDVVTTHVSGQWLAPDTPTVLPTLAEELMAPSFPQPELNKLVARWTASMRQSEDLPGTRLARAFSQLLFPPGHPYRELDLAPALAAVQGLTRQDLVDFHQRYYGPDHTTLVLVGKVQPMDAVHLLETATAGWPRARAATRETIPDVALSPPKRVLVPMPDQTNVTIRYGHVGGLKRSSPDYDAAMLANYVLGGDTLTGRLGLTLRDQLGLTYGVSSGYSASAGMGAWRAGVTVNPSNVDVAVHALRSEVQRFLREGLTASELDFAKSAFIGSQAVNLSTNTGMASSLAALAFYHLGLDDWSRYPQRIRAVTVDAANAAARRTLHPEAASVVLVGPVGETTK